jgi:hypothetical protein
MAIDFREEGPPADDEALAGTEAAIGLALPAGYRDFLRASNGGFLEQSGYFDEDVVVEEIFSAGQTDIRNLDVIEGMYERYAGARSDQGLPTELIPAGADPLGNLICVSAADGMVYFWDHELVGQAHRNLGVGFNEFMAGLRAEDEFFAGS